MKRVYKKKVSKQNATARSYKAQRGLIFPPFYAETKIERIREEKEDRRNIAEKKIKEKYKKSDWVLVDDDDIIVQIWGVMGETLLDKKRRGDVFFYLWKYSGMSVLLEKDNDNELSNEQIDFVMREISYKKYFWNNRIINNFGEEELTQKGTKAEKTKGGAIRYTMAQNDPLHRAWVERIPLEIINIPFSVIEYILAERKNKKK